MYPLKFENIYFEKIWGGRDLRKFRNNLIEGNIGESWDISCHETAVSIVSNGEFKGKNLKFLIEKFGVDLVGTKFLNKKFPLLVKLINSREKLSVQVHPNDDYSNKYENQFGKTEAWYILDAQPNSQIIVGTKDCNRETFEKAIKDGNIEKYLNKIPVNKGDCFLIRSGLVHAICEGIIIAEIQQNSDITYRVYDYGREREIHVDKSLQVINFELQAINLSKNKVQKFDGYSKVDFTDNEYFTMEKYTIESKFIDKSNSEKFFIITCVDGKGKIVSNNLEYNIEMGDSLLIPANLGDYIIYGELSIIKSYPN